MILAWVVLAIGCMLFGVSVVWEEEAMQAQLLALEALNLPTQSKPDPVFTTQDLPSRLVPYPHLDAYRKSPLREPRPRPTHGCVFHHGQSYCRFQKFQVHVQKIIAKADGGEPLEDVMGQAEQDEFLKYEPGAFTVPEPFESSLDLSNKRILHTKEVIRAIEVAPSTCHTSSDRLTFFMARYDYVHIYL